MEWKEWIDRRRYIILDGGMGTMLQARGLPLGARPELLALENPGMLEEIHREYALAGADLILANTFGASPRKLASTGHTVEEIVPAAIRAARKGTAGTGALVALDIGPLGELLEPAGSLTFEEAYENFRQVVLAGREADAILIETMTDLYELKAALLAAKENSSLPVLVSMSFEENGRTFTGCTVESFGITAAALGADGVGINCSLGPVQILPFARRLCRVLPGDMPVFIKANAGLPRADGSGYDVTPAQFRDQMLEYRDLGISGVGGCCGTTPEFIRLLKESFGTLTPARRESDTRSWLCTPTKAVEVSGVTVVGERINPTGKKRFQQALRQGDMDYIILQAVEQAQAGAQVLDVNVGLPDIDEPAMMEQVVKALQEVTDLPLQLDSTNPQALERGLRVYNGRPIVNSINGEGKVMEAILPLCKKYGAAVVGLTLDEGGIPPTAQGRFEIAQRMVERCGEYGIPPRDIYIDCLTLTVSAQQSQAMETLNALERCKKELGVRTALGVSNISFGLPDRVTLNTAFLTMAMDRGLDLPIINPNLPQMMGAVRAFRVLTGQDPESGAYIAAYGGESPAAAPAVVPGNISLGEAVERGLKKEAAQAARQALEQQDPMDLVNQVLIPALDRVGDGFEKGTIFLPQLLQAAGAAQAAFQVVRDALAVQGGGQGDKGKIVLATVKGDIHDIGKNIVKVILENYGFTVYDLGKDVDPRRVVEEVQRTGAPLVGLSALMTTTVKSMEETIRALHQAGCPCKVMVGGAVMTPEYAARIGADFYAKDAKMSADIARKLLEKA